MRLTPAPIVSCVYLVCELVIFIAVVSSDRSINSGRRPQKSQFLRSRNRKLYNYSNQNSNSNNNNYNSGNDGYSGSYGDNNAYMNPNYSDGSGGYGGMYGGDYGSSYGGDYGSSYGGDYGSSYGGGYGDSYDGSYGNNYANYQANDYNNDQNYQNQNYDNSNYIWQGDDDNYQASSSGGYYYNGRGESWGGQSVQAYTDDEEPEIEEEGQDEADEEWDIFGKINGLSAKETVAVSVLSVVVGMSMLFLLLLACGCNMIDFIGLYCCCGLFGHTDQSSSPTETIDDGFVKLDNY